MALIQASFDDFSNWYEKNKDQLIKGAIIGKNTNDNVKSEFILEYPMSRLSNLSLDEYVTGKGPSSQSFCYQLEFGKYKHLYLGMQGGSAGKFNIYWNQEHSVYRDGNNIEIPSKELNNKFTALKEELVSILQKGEQLEFNDQIFDEKLSDNTFFRKPAMITKLLCAYSEKEVFTGINMKKDQKQVWSKMLPLEEHGWVYKQNYEITKTISEKYSELNGGLLSAILWDYHNRIMDSEENNVQETGVKIGSSNDVESEGLPSFNNEQSQMLLNSKNVIFRGAPGTGKSYLAKQIAADIVSNGEIEKYSELNAEQKSQIEFVQFHPSYDYTDFVEGLRPKVNIDGTMGFQLEPGVFTKFINKARKNYENAHKNKSELINENKANQALQKFLSEVDLDQNEFKTIRGKKFNIADINENKIIINIPDNEIVKVLDLTIPTIQQMLISNQKFDKVTDLGHFLGKDYTTQNNSYELALFKKITKLKDKLPTITDGFETERPYIFIIDEINRGEISKIFGELFFSIDPGYRGEEGAVLTQYANLHEDETEKFYIPQNVYIIGTMNDIDRSVDSFDFAMRRRFRFVNITASDRIQMLDELDGTIKNEAILRMKSLNQAISAVDELSDNYNIGASYFLKLKELNFDQLWDDYLLPLLQDYVRGLYNEDDILNSFSHAYHVETIVLLQRADT